MEYREEAEAIALKSVPHPFGGAKIVKGKTYRFYRFSTSLDMFPDKNSKWSLINKSDDNGVTRLDGGECIDHEDLDFVWIKSCQRQWTVI